MKISVISLSVVFFLLTQTTVIKSEFHGMVRLENEKEEIITTFVSQIDNSEKQAYQDLLDTKLSFQNSFDFLPKNFQPEESSYWGNYNTLIVRFVIIACIPLVFFIIYLLLRFVYNKFKGPKNINEIQYSYKVITWVVFGISTAAVLGIFTTIIVFSEKSRAAHHSTFNEILNNLTQFRQEIAFLPVFTQKYEENLNKTGLNFTGYSKKLEDGLKRYTEKSNANIQDAKKMEKIRAISAILFGFGYLLIAILALVSYKLLIEQIAVFLNVFTYFTLIGLIIYEGYTSKFFFYYGDLCDSVSKTMYSGEFPVANKALGTYFNCLEKETKFNLYVLNNQLYKFKNSEFKPDDGDLTELEKSFEKLIACKSVYQAVPHLEKNFCAHSLKWIYTELQLFLFLFVAVFCLAIAIGRIRVLVWRKNEEIKSMMSNMEAIY